MPDVPAAPPPAPAIRAGIAQKSGQQGRSASVRLLGEELGDLELDLTARLAAEHTPHTTSVRLRQVAPTSPTTILASTHSSLAVRLLAAAHDYSTI